MCAPLSSLFGVRSVQPEVALGSLVHKRSRQIAHSQFAVFAFSFGRMGRSQPSFGTIVFPSDHHSSSSECERISSQAQTRSLSRRTSCMPLRRFWRGHTAPFRRAGFREAVLLLVRVSRSVLYLPVAVCVSGQALFSLTTRVALRSTGRFPRRMSSWGNYRRTDPPPLVAGQHRS